MSFKRNQEFNQSSVATIDGTAGGDWTCNLGRTKINLAEPRASEWWTGKPPWQCPGFRMDGKLHALSIPNLATSSNNEVLDYFNNGWTLTEVLFSSLNSEESFYRPPYHDLRHPLIFYFLHPCVLYINKLRLAGLITNPVDPYFESLFETGVDEMSWDDMSKNRIFWPTIEQALEYRRKVYCVVSEVIVSHQDLSKGHAPINQKHPLWSMFMGMEHERIHLETSSVLIRELPVNLVTQPEYWPNMSDYDNESGVEIPEYKVNFPENKMLKIQSSKVVLGKPQDWPTFGWDNEYGNRTSEISQFEASQCLISNGEYWQFVHDGGYSNEDNWSKDGWRWRSFRNVKSPSFWVADGPAGSFRYKLRTCFKVIAMPWDWPVLVNFHEAKAFCKWKSSKDGKTFQLISEAQHHALRASCDYQNYDNFNSLTIQGYNLELCNGSESKVTQYGVSINNSDDKFYDLFGNVWQWTEDHFNPLEGARVHKYYDDFSTPCYDGKHQMIMGGSFVSVGDEATPWARFHFRPHFFQHAGFRIAHIADGGTDGSTHLYDTKESTYETQELLNQYMTLHFAPAEVQMPFEFGPVHAVSFPQRCADVLLQWCDRLAIKKEKALDIGCAVGGAAFRLAEQFNSVIGVDLSESFIDTAKRIKENGDQNFYSFLEGELIETHKAKVSQTAATRTQFRQADACALPAEYLDFDAVLMANLLCRLPSPGACLGRLAGERGIVGIGGLVVICSPYTWMEKFTPKDVWLGGFVDENGNKTKSEEGLIQFLSPNFELLEKRDMPLVIREHHRKYQYIVSQLMVWRRLS